MQGSLTVGYNKSHGNVFWGLKGILKIDKYDTTAFPPSVTQRTRWDLQHKKSFNHYSGTYFILLLSSVEKGLIVVVYQKLCTHVLYIGSKTQGLDKYLHGLYIFFFCHFLKAEVWMRNFLSVKAVSCIRKKMHVCNKKYLNIYI